MIGFNLKMSAGEAQLPVQCFAALRDTRFDNDFTFIINGKNYDCPSFIAQVISPVVCDYLKRDNTLDSFDLGEIPEKGNFEEIINLAYGDSITITPINAKFIHHVGQVLGNKHIIQMSLMKPEDPESAEGILWALYENTQNGLPIETEIDAAADKFEEMDKVRLIGLGFEVCEKILNSRYLSVSSEGTVLHFVSDALEIGGDEFVPLINSIQPDNLASEDMPLFVAVCEKVSFDKRIWSTIAHRLLKSKSIPTLSVSQKARRSSAVIADVSSDSEEEKHKHKHTIKVEFNEADPFNGLLNYLKAAADGANPAEIGAIVITASSSLIGSPKSVVEGSIEGFCTRNSRDEWLQLDFCSKRVAITGYSIKSYNYGPGNNQMRTFTLRGSTDLLNWSEIDARVDVEELNGCGTSSSFSISKAQPFRFIRIQLAAPNWNNRWFLSLSRIELFGELTLTQ